MKKNKVIIISIFCIVAVGCLGLIGREVWKHMQIQREADMRRKAEEEMLENERIERERIAIAYSRVNIAFGAGQEYFRVNEEMLAPRGKYLPLAEPSEHSGIRWRLYVLLRMYENKTGNYLSYDKVVDYFSEEFEPDGTLRLYNNGFHPEIEAFINWRSELEPMEFPDFIASLRVIYAVYLRDHSGEGFVMQNMDDFSPQFFDALARKEADPDYELDLTSLQQQGY